MVKVGDRVRVVGYNGLYKSYDSYGTTGIVTRIHDNGNLDMKTDKGFIRCGHPEDFSVISTEPPQKITQNGYEYSLVGPVKPDWLVDGAWVVNVENGEKRLIKEERPGVFNLCVNDLVSIRYHEGIRDQYRPHEPKDWKWGDWAMYAGRKVFVTEKGNWMGDIRVSHPDLPDGVACVPVLQLTPTF